MRWFDSGIAKAVEVSKKKNAYFVVYIEGSDEKSKQMSSVLNESEVSGRLKMDDVFVCIKLEGNSESYNQFTQIYKLVPTPSLFFIGDNGVPVEIITSDKASSSSVLIPIIDSLISKKGKSYTSLSGESSSKQSAAKSATSSFIAAEQESTNKSTLSSAKSEQEKKNENEEFETVCEGGVCYKKPKAKDSPEGDSGIVTPSTSSEAMDVETEKGSEEKSTITIEDKVQRAKDLLEQKRKEKLEKEKEEEKRKELERRSQGKGVAELKKWQQEQEFKNLKEERLKEKKENEMQRAKILQQIAQDRADKLAQMNANNSGASKPEPPAQSTIPKPPETNSNITRIQFKMADGSSHTTQFESDSTLSEVKQYVKQNLQPYGSQGFTLSIMYPRQMLGDDKNSETLRTLGLCPSSVLILLKKDGSISGSGSSSPIANYGGFFGMISHIFWSFIVHPVQGVWFWFTSFFRGNRDAPRSPAPSPTNAPSTSKDFRRFPSEDESGVKKRRVGGSSGGGSGTTSFRREGNTFRLQDNDSDDENNTWNGNSTQQM